MSAKKYYITKDWLNQLGKIGWNSWYRFIEVDVETKHVNFYDYDYILDKSMSGLLVSDIDLENGGEEIGNPFNDIVYDNSDFYI